MELRQKFQCLLKNSAPPREDSHTPSEHHCCCILNICLIDAHAAYLVFVILLVVLGNRTQDLMYAGQMLYH